MLVAHVRLGSVRGPLPVLLAVAGLLSAPRALAQSSPGKPAHGAPAEDQEARKRDAKAKFIQGRDALNRGEYATALILFRTSQELYPSPGTLLNLALCEERLGMLGSALQHFQEVVRLLPPGDDRVSIAKNGLATIEPRVPRLRIDLAKGAPQGTSLARDGAPLAASDVGKEVLLDPGKHIVVVRAPGRPDRHYEVTLVEGAREVLTVEPGRAPEIPVSDPNVGGPPRVGDGAPVNPGSGRAPEPGGGAGIGAPDTVRPEPSSTLRTAGFIAGGVGIASIGVGAVTGILAFVKKGDVDSLCPREDICSEEGVEAERSGKAFATASTVAFAVGLAGVGAGAVLLVMSGGKTAPKPAAAIAPLVLPGGAGIGARGRF